MKITSSEETRMSSGSQAEKQNRETVLDQLDRSELLTLIKQMIQIYPTLAQLVDALPDTHEEQQRASSDPEFYRLKVAHIFETTDRDTWGSEGRAAGPLLDIVEISDTFLEKEEYADAVMIYETVIRATLDQYTSFRWHAYEGDLDEVVEHCVDELETCLQKQPRNTALQTHIIQTLRDVYEFDMNLDNDEPVMSRKIPAVLVRRTTSTERKTLATWVRKTFGLDIDWENDDFRDDHDPVTSFLLGLESDLLDDETFLRICRERENYAYLIERLLTRGRDEEALAAAQQVDTYDILEIAEIFCEHGHEAEAERLIEGRSQHSQRQELLEWLQERYQARGDLEATLAMACRLFAIPLGATIERYREIRQLAEPSGQWATVQAELLASVKQSRNIKLQIEIALDEGQMKEALALLQSQQQKGDTKNGPYGGDLFSIGIEVAKAIEETEPLEAIAIYQKYVQTRVAWRGRDNYHTACQYLVTVRRLFQKMGKSNLWTTYLMDLRGQNSKLPALKDEMVKAGL